MKITNRSGRYEIEHTGKWYHATYDGHYSSVVIRHGRGEHGRAEYLLESLVCDLITKNVDLLNDPLAWEDHPKGPSDKGGRVYGMENILVIRHA